MQVHLKTLGCRLNEAELEMWAQGFQQAGLNITADAKEADLIVLNSCAVTQDAVRKSRQQLRRIHRDNPNANIVLSGCYATLQPEEAGDSIGVDLVVSNRDKQQLVAKSLQLLNHQSMPAMATEPGAVSLFNRGRQRAFIKVQDGCRYRCTFCIVTKARGEENSRNIRDIINEINVMQQQGIHEIILTGVHLGGFGSDINSNISSLLHHILQETDIPRIRLGSLEPWDLADDFFSLFDNPRLMPHLHLPLQSGSDSVLKRMARRCKVNEFKRLADLAKQNIENFNLTTDIIVGFPGETESEWQETLATVEQLAFGDMHIFTYSKRSGTSAAEFSEQVHSEVKKQRSRQLHALAEKSKQAFIEQHLGKTFPVLWEGNHSDTPNKQLRLSGYTPNYIKVNIQTSQPESLQNRIIATELQKIDDGKVYSRVS